MAPRTRSKARATPASLFDRLNDDLQNMIVWATPKAALPPAAALRGVNKKLRTMQDETRTWHEWAAWMEKWI